MPPHLLGISAIARVVVRILRPAADRRVVERPVPGVLELEGHPAGQPLNGFELQLMNGGIAAGSNPGDRSPGLIGPARLNVAWRLGLGIVELTAVVPKMRRMVANIRCTHAEIPRHFPLNGEVPLVGFVVLEAGLDASDGRIAGWSSCRQKVLPA